MIELQTEARSFYWCQLSEEDEQKVRDFAKENNVGLTYAIEELWMRDEIEIYRYSTESDFSTEKIYNVIDRSEEEEEEDEE